MKICCRIMIVVMALAAVRPAVAADDNDWEITPQSEEALERGLAWLAANQTAEGNWQSNDLGLVSMGALAFLAAGHSPGKGKYGTHVTKALDYVVQNAKQPSGLLNISGSQRDMYNHGLSTFVLGQAYGMTNDARLNQTLDKALKVIYQTQCRDGGWDYQARAQENGHDLSLDVMQAKAIRSAVDSGLEVPPEVIQAAIRCVRQHYVSAQRGSTRNEAELKEGPGQFVYERHGSKGTLAMAAAGVVCLQEFGQYDDWRIPKNMEVLRSRVLEKKDHYPKSRDGLTPFDAYTLYYVGQALYQVGGNDWRECYPVLRDFLVAGQCRDTSNRSRDGGWFRAESGGIGDQGGGLYSTAVSCFILAIPNRYLPILQEGKIDSLKGKFQAN